MDVDTNVAYEKPINFTNGTFISQHASEDERPCKQTQFPPRPTPMYFIYTQKYVTEAKSHTQLTHHDHIISMQDWRIRVT